MVTPQRSGATAQRAAPVGRIITAMVIGMLLTLSQPGHAEESSAGGDAAVAGAASLEPDASLIAPAPASRNGGSARLPPVKRMTSAQRIDRNVRRLTRGLDLDAGQQEGLRQILVDQHRQLAELRGNDTAAGTDVAAKTFAIYDQTRERIRGILSDEQKKKYAVDVPRSELAPAQADLHHWMDLQEARRREEQSEEAPK